MNQHIQATDPIYTTALLSTISSCTALGCSEAAHCPACVKQTEADINAYEMDMQSMAQQEAQQHQFTYCSHEHPCKFCAAQLMDAQDIESLDELYRVEGEILVAYEQSTEKRRKSQNEFWAIQNVIEAITKIEDKAYELKRKLEKLQDMDVA